MDKKTAEELVEIIRKEYEGKERGSEFPHVLGRVVDAGGYKNADKEEIISVKRQIVAILRDLAA